MQDDAMTNATFVVAGGSSGLGAACVRRLLDAGSHVVVADLRAPADELAEHPRCRYRETDVTDDAAVRAAFDLDEQVPPLRGAIVCAGVIHGERITSRAGPADLDAFRRVVEVNLVGTFNVLRHAADVLRNSEPDAEGERGVIVTTSSVAAFEGQIGQAAYSASKGGVAALTLPAARELGREGIRVVSIAPGVFATPMMGEVPERTRESLESAAAFPARFGDPDDYAALVHHVLVNSMLNGCVLRLDGGLRLPPR